MTNLFRIGEFSKIGKTSIKTLRYYDECGILKPAKVDIFNNYRYYSTAQLAELYKIQSLRYAGLSIAEIIDVCHGADDLSLLQKKRGELIDDLSHLQNQISCIDFLLAGKERSMYSAVIKTIPECIVFSKTGCAKNYSEFMSIIPAIGAEVAAVNPTLKCVSPDYCFISYLDEGYHEENVRFEFCQAVESFGVETETIKFKKLPSVEVVSVLHKGHYDELGGAYAFVFEWMEANGYTVAGFPRECYIDGIWNCESVDDWLTEIQIPIKNRG